MPSKDYRGLFDLTDKVAAVTGGAGGLGREAVLALGQHGCHVAVVDLDTSKVRHLESAFGAMGRNISFFDADIARSDQVSQVFGDIMKAYGKLDILVNMAGINKRLPVVEFPEEDWDKIMNINLKGTFLCCKEAAKIMKAQGQGKIINMGSVSSVLGHPNHSAYAASKAGVLLLTKVLAMELATCGVNVNAIGPAYVETDLTRDYLKVGDHYESIARSIPMGRLGTPEDVAGAIVYLASKASDFVTGTLLLVDGGRCAD